MEFEKYENPENIEHTENLENPENMKYTESAEETTPLEPTFRAEYYQEPVGNPQDAAPAGEPVYEPYAGASSNPEQPYSYQYAYQPMQSEIPPKKQKGNGGKVFLRVLSVILAFAIGAGAATWLSFLALPKLVEKEMKQYHKGNPGIYLTPPNPSMTAEEAGNPNQGEKELLSVVEISQKVGPVVVGIDTTVERQSIFGTSAMESGSGSGIILSNDGYIVTNNHVIEGAYTITVTLSDGTQYDATLVGADARTDLAVIKIEGESFPAATLGNSSVLQVGELAIAIGNPLGNELAGSVTGGYISALNRSITVDDREFNLIQTDAAINPGNSGGALVNNYGEVIGINSVKMSASGVEGIGFAIPIDEAKPIIDDLIANGYVKGRPVIGISGRDVTEQDAMYYDLPVGIYVVETSPYSAAERAGIKTGDVIVAIDGVEITTVDELNTEKEKHQAGETVVLTVVRGTETKQISLTLQEDKPIMEAN